jgi:hypothetical protein
MAATVDYLFAFAATTGAVRDAHFDAVYQAYLMDEETLAFLREPRTLMRFVKWRRNSKRRSSVACGRRKAIRPSSRLASWPDRRCRAGMNRQGGWPISSLKDMHV